MSDLDAGRVSARLEELRRIYVAERVDAGARRLALERPVDREPFDVAVGRRLRELRALCELARYLHRAGSPTEPGECKQGSITRSG